MNPMRSCLFCTSGWTTRSFAPTESGDSRRQSPIPTLKKTCGSMCSTRVTERVASREWMSRPTTLSSATAWTPRHSSSTRPPQRSSGAGHPPPNKTTTAGPSPLETTASSTSPPGTEATTTRSSPWTTHTGASFGSTTTAAFRATIPLSGTGTAATAARTRGEWSRKTPRRALCARRSLPTASGIHSGSRWIRARPKKPDSPCRTSAGATGRRSTGPGRIMPGGTTGIRSTRVPACTGIPTGVSFRTTTTSSSPFTGTRTEKSRRGDASAPRSLFRRTAGGHPTTPCCLPTLFFSRFTI
mmetsp:Transcript_28865/g.78203  ORF Transcript_28865/g.78203 Transcript_28865/m.78203 type:complete len:299 (-) Transcript_28865:740-1636(-)